MRPSLEAVRSKLYLAAISRTAFSAMLGLPSVTLMTACSKPEDFVNRRTDFFFAARAGCERRSPAPAAAVVRRKSRRVESGFIFLSLDIDDSKFICQTRAFGRRRSVLRGGEAGQANECQADAARPAPAEPSS